MDRGNVPVYLYICNTCLYIPYIYSFFTNIIEGQESRVPENNWSYN